MAIIFIFLTIMTATNLLKKINTLARQYKEPVTYFSGVDSYFDSLPRKVLQFHRDFQLGSEDKIHYRFVLIGVLSMPGSVIVDGEIFRLEPGQGILIFPHQAHHYTRFETSENVSWLFTTFEHDKPEIFGSLHNTPFTYGSKDQERLLHLTETFFNWSETKTDAGQEVPLQLALLLSGLINRQKSFLKKAGGKPVHNSPKHVFIQKLTRYINANLNQTLSVEDLAKTMSLSSSRLRTKFREATNISLGDFIRRTRIHRACGLLHSTDLTITEISEMCGFSSLYHFSRTFKKITEKSPNQFRKYVRTNHLDGDRDRKQAAE